MLDCGPADTFPDKVEHERRMTSVLELVDRQYALAGHPRCSVIVVDFAPIPGIISACGRVFSELDREDERQRRIARAAWILKTTILQTVLPFDDPRLGISALAGEMRVAAETIPNIFAVATFLAKEAEELVSSRLNPKRQRFLELVGGVDMPTARIGVLAALHGPSTPGWPLGLSPIDDFEIGSISILRTRKDLRDQVFERAVITGTTRSASRPLVYDLLYGGRARDVVVLSYGKERAYVPKPIALPANSFFPTAAAAATVDRMEIVGEGPDSQLDSWATESFWQEVRARHGDVAPTSDRDVTVAARFVLFADGSGAFLPEDRAIVEISDLLDAGGDLDVAEDRLPRKAVRDLEEADLVMLRLTGGGHYVEDLADGLMAREGLESLRGEATEWKAWLHRTLKQCGEGFVAKAGREVGLRLRSASYLWVWAGDAVIAPQEFETFRALIRTLIRLEPTPGIDQDKYAMDKWQQMEHVKAFHVRAGSVIRTALLKRVKGLVAERHKIATVESIELPGLEAGRMGLLRVSAVDAKAMQIPLSRLFQITPVKVD